ncbi:MAG TPA: tetratricopeptide repeat protein [Gallionella sp.]|nr:tetratricopeptide repeat protein [Gallionella sp.]
MKNRNGLFVVAVALLMLGGCSGVKAPPAATATVTPGGVTTAPEVQLQQPGAESVPPAPAPLEPVPSSAKSNNRAIVALLDRAEGDSKANQHDAAGALLERALRIEPRNPWLWHQLAQVRLAQGQYAQAITLARKSNSFAGKQHRVQADNWQLIGNARVAQGDTAGAEQAFKQSADLVQQDKAESGFSFFR